jgi:hypothetical protein
VYTIGIYKVNGHIAGQGRAGQGRAGQGILGKCFNSASMNSFLRKKDNAVLGEELR